MSVLKPLDRVSAWPEQSADMRAEDCCVFLRQILAEPLYMEMRTAVCRWVLAGEPESVRTIAKRAAWERKKAAS